MFEAKSLICSEDIRVEAVMQCLMGMRDLETKIYFSLLEKPGTPMAVSERLGKSRSLVQRSLQNLIGYGLAYRRPVKRPRGRAYEYVAVPKEEVKNTLKHALKEWSSTVEKTIEDW
jgi:predicted transcriptional regulator